MDFSKAFISNARIVDMKRFAYNQRTKNGSSEFLKVTIENEKGTYEVSAFGEIMESIENECTTDDFITVECSFRGQPYMNKGKEYIQYSFTVINYSKHASESSNVQLDNIPFDSPF